MKRLARTLLIGLAALLLVFALGVAAVVVFVDPNAFKPEIETLLQEATGKTVQLPGTISLSLFPNLHVAVGPVELQDDDSFGSEPFVRVEKMSASVAVGSLFSGRPEIGNITVSGLRLKLAVNTKGQANWSVPGAPSGELAPASPPSDGAKQAAGYNAIVLDSLRLDDAVVVYMNMRSKERVQVTLASFVLDSFRVGQKTRLSFEAAYAGATPRPVALAASAEFVLPPDFSQKIAFTAKGHVDATPFSCSGTASLPRIPDGPVFSFKGDMSLGALDVDRYLETPNTAKPATRTDKQQGTKAGESEEVKKAFALLSLDVQLAIQSLTVAKIPVSGIKAAVRVDKGLLVAKPVTMTVAGGPLNIDASVDAREKAVRTLLAGNWKNARVGDLIRAATGKTPFTGILDTAWSLNATGMAWPEAAKTLDGKVTASLVNGAAPAFNLIPSGVPGLPAKKLGLSDMRGSGTWNIAKGIAQNNDLAVKAVGLDAAGAGRINIASQTLHYTLSVNMQPLSGAPSLTVLPLVVSGPLSSPSYSIDQPALLRDSAKSLLPKPSQRVDGPQKAGRAIGNTLGKILGR